MGVLHPGLLKGGVRAQRGVHTQGEAGLACCTCWAEPSRSLWGGEEGVTPRCGTSWERSGSGCDGV